jgi:hypothetical protein
MQQQILEKWQQYPVEARSMLCELRQLILTIAQQQELGEVTEEVKWGQASFRVQCGSPIRMDWDAKDAEHCYLYFHCQTRLVDTYQELYADRLKFEGNRSIVLPLNEPLLEPVISHCMTLALTYKRVKHMPLLGA